MTAKTAASTEKAPAAKATKPAPEAVPIAELVEHIKRQAHQDRDFMGGGWDVIEDTWTDEMIMDAIKGARTNLGAQSKMSKHVNAYRAEKRAAREAAKAAEKAEAAKTQKAEG